MCPPGENLAFSFIVCMNNQSEISWQEVVPRCLYCIEFLMDIGVAIFTGVWCNQKFLYYCTLLIKSQLTSLAVVGAHSARSACIFQKELCCVRSYLNLFIFKFRSN